MTIRFGRVSRAEVLGALKASGSTDPDVLLAAKEEFASRYRPLKWVGIWAIVSGALATALVILAFIGIPLLLVGVFWLRRAGQNMRTIEAAFAEHLASVTGRAVPASPAVAMPAARALGLLALALALPAGLAAQNDAALPEWVGEWGPKGSCGGPLKLVVAPKQLTLVNGKDRATEGNLTIAASWFGASYQGIMLPLLADWDQRQPFMVTFNAGEKPGDAVVEISDAALRKRSPR
ncbi:MAG: hypothetical protein MUC69_05855, partial [Gemmatimonadales bacterium]|nr:hypothetical protein [Gemmatimonadales bacterium]